MLTQAELQSELLYDPGTGWFTWKVTRAKARAGNRAGTPQKRGHRGIRIRGKLYSEHRLAWLYMTGDWPENDVDHEDRNKRNNAFRNLRPATRQQNCCNRSLMKNSTSGVPGVYWDITNQCWWAKTYRKGRYIYASRHMTKEEAIAAKSEQIRRLSDPFSAADLH